jgi:DtxR family Mn-dependent transcriptional regulator
VNVPVNTQSLRPSDRAEEALEALWVGMFEGNRHSMPLADPSLAGHEEALAELLRMSLVNVKADVVELTIHGLALATQTVRRHRLAEMMLANVLEINNDRMDDAACGIEHSLREGVDEAVCTLLGHPQRCPHGKPIPPGDCCRRVGGKVVGEVAPLSKLYPGQSGRIAYVQTGEAKKLQKLMAMGVLPGKGVRLIQGFPSFVFQVGQSQFAVDDEMASTIFVRTDRA